MASVCHRTGRKSKAHEFGAGTLWEVYCFLLFWSNSLLYPLYPSILPYPKTSPSSSVLISLVHENNNYHSESSWSHQKATSGHLLLIRSFPDSSVGKESAYNTGEGSTPGLGRTPGEGKGF